jgi:hypothetical protein
VERSLSMARPPLTKSQRNTRSRANANIRTIKAAQASAQSLEATKTEQAAAREAAHSSQRLQTEQGLRRQRQTSNIKQAAVGKVVDTATPSSNSGLVMTTIFVMAGLIVMYLLVTASANTAGFLGGLGKWIHTIGTSNSPLFIKKPTGTTG